MTNKERTTAFLATLSKYAKGFILGALVIIGLNSYEYPIVIQKKDFISGVSEKQLYTKQEKKTIAPPKAPMDSIGDLIEEKVK